MPIPKSLLGDSLAKIPESLQIHSLIDQIEETPEVVHVRVRVPR